MKKTKKLIELNGNSDLLKRLRIIVNKHDPIGLYADEETNPDEYDAEILRMVKFFDRSFNVDDYTQGTHQIFIEMFNEEIAGPASAYEGLAKEFYELLEKEINVVP